MRHFQFMRGGSMSKDTHQVDHHHDVVVVVVVDERGQLWNCGSSPLARLNLTCPD